MKRIIALIMCAFMVIACFAEGDTETPQLGEGEILMHGYQSPFANYYIGVPAEWAIIGAGSTEANLSEASALLEDIDVYSFKKQLDKQTDVLYCCSKDGAGLILTYGESTGLTNDVLVNRLQQFEDEITASCPGVVFEADSGSYTYNSVFELLHIGMNYKGRHIDQYYMVTGTQLYLFAFFGTTASLAETVLSTFSVQ